MNCLIDRRTRRSTNGYSHRRRAHVREPDRSLVREESVRFSRPSRFAGENLSFASAVKKTPNDGMAFRDGGTKSCRMFTRRD